MRVTSRSHYAKISRKTIIVIRTHKEWKSTHGNVARAIHWDQAGKCGFERNERWCDHVRDSALENDNYKLLGEFSVRTDYEIGARKLDLMINAK